MQFPVAEVDYITMLEALTLIVLTINIEILADDRAWPRFLRLLPLFTLILGVSLMGALGLAVTSALHPMMMLAAGLKMASGVILPLAGWVVWRQCTRDHASARGLQQSPLNRLSCEDTRLLQRWDIALALGLVIYGICSGAGTLYMVLQLHVAHSSLALFMGFQGLALFTLFIPWLASMSSTSAQFWPHLNDSLARRLYRSLRVHTFFFVAILVSGWLLITYLSSWELGRSDVVGLRFQNGEVSFLTDPGNGSFRLESAGRYLAVRTLGLGLTAIIFLVFMAMYYRYRAGFLNSLRMRSSQLRSLTAEQRYIAAIENMPGFFVLFTPGTGTVLMANQHFSSFLQTSTEKILGRSLPDICKGDQVFLADTLLTASRDLHQSVVVETESHWPTGKRVSLQWTLAPVRSPTSPSTEIIALAVDITELRTTEKSLQKAKENAERANEAKGHFLANMSHEIRTPINGILGMTGILLDTPLTREQRHCAEVASASARSLLQIVNDILDYSKIEAGRIDLELVEFEVGNVLEFVSELLAHEAAQKGLNLSFVVNRDVPRLLRGDPGRLRQVLLNLCGNAIKFTHVGEVSVRVSLESPPNRTVMLRFEIIDTGIGIAEGEQHKLFQVFSQVHNHSHEPKSGTGLGLAISSKLVQMMSGQIGVTSRPSEGSRFWFTASFSVGKETEPLAKPLTGRKALVVDRSANVRAMFLMQLELLGASCSESSSLQEAVHHDARFDFVLLEHALPALGEQDFNLPPSLEGSRIVLVVRHNEHPDPRMVRMAGFSGTLTKPANLAVMQETVSAALGLPPPARPARTLRTLSQQSFAKAGLPELRVLVAEDNLVNQELTVYHLTKMGCRTTVVNDGREALETVQREQFDVILMDIQMPGMDGVSATRHIRKLERGSGRHTPIIAMTAHAMKGDREKYLAEGMDDYVAKPVEFVELVGAIERQLGIHIQDQPTPAAQTAPAATSSAPVFDRQGALARIGGDEQILKRIMSVFLLEAPSCLSRLEKALKHGDLREADEWAHSLKGACGAVGAHAMLTAVLELRTALQSAPPNEISYYFQTLSLEFQRTQSALEMEISPKI